VKSNLPYWWHAHLANAKETVSSFASKTGPKCGCTALNTVYDEIVAKVKEVIQQSPQTVGVTTDMWTDNYKRRSYMSVTMHFCSPEFHFHSIVLRTALFTEAHTGMNIQIELQQICEQFGLNDKNVVYITDQGSNIVMSKLHGLTLRHWE